MAAAAPELKVAPEQDPRSIYLHYHGSRKGGHEVSERVGRRPHVNRKRRIVIGALVPQSCLAHRVICFHGIPLGKSLKNPTTYSKDASADGWSWCRGSPPIGLGGRAEAVRR